MKVYVIEGRRGFYHVAERIFNFPFPAGFGSLKAATQFPFKSAAERTMKKYHLKDAPHHCHIEEKDYNDLNN